jgi:hypothetical protein
MITLSLLAIGQFAARVIAVLLIMLFGAMIFLWPINDGKISKTQKILYGIFSAISAMCIFGVIKFSA